MFQNSKIEIINHLGQAVLLLNYSDAVDVSELPAGLYTLKVVSSGKESLYAKFIKE